jgi:hypothetical protein
MRFILALKAFFKALKDPTEAQRFISGGQCGEQTESDPSHLRLLALLQHSSRLIDFLKEDISSFEDAQIGAAARKIHEDSGKCLEELVTIRPLMDQNEGDKINIPEGYDASKIKIVGKVKGGPPFTGILVHKGWKAHKRSLPKKSGGQPTEVISPAEIEIN